jgi:hypothetical protein
MKFLFFAFAEDELRPSEFDLVLDVAMLLLLLKN